MGLIADLNPTNYQEEKTRFLADPTFNPRFTYTRKFDHEELISHGFPQEKYFHLAEKILEKTFEQYSPEDIVLKRGPLLDQEIVTRIVKKFLELHNLVEKIEILWSEDFVGRTAVAGNTIKFRYPCSIRAGDLEGLIFHEVGTHVLRTINYKQQPWYKKKKLFGFQPYLRTEEGLSVIHMIFPKSISLAYMPAINYIATYKAQHGSFLEVWQFLKQYIPKDEVAFVSAFKKKRGITDTGQSGGFTRDVVYLEGFVDTINFLINNNFPLKELYFGKLAYQDIDKALTLNPDFKPILPIFYTQDPTIYQERVREIAQINFIT